MNRLLAFVAFAGVAGFLAILAVEVPSPDLLAVILISVALVGIDFFLATRKNRN